MTTLRGLYSDFTRMGGFGLVRTHSGFGHRRVHWRQRSSKTPVKGRRGRLTAAKRWLSRRLTVSFSIGPEEVNQRVWIGTLRDVIDTATGDFDSCLGVDSHVEVGASSAAGAQLQSRSSGAIFPLEVP